MTLAHALPEIPAESPWLLALFVACTAAAVGSVAAAVAAWNLAARARDLARRAPALDRLEDLARDVHSLAQERSDLDLRRVEHVLIELRDAQKRLEDVLLRHAEATREALVRGDGGSVALVAGGEGLGERTTNRLLAMGYERVQIITRVEKLAELAARDGEILVEARKEGVLHKGRVAVRGGRIASVELHPAYSIFP